MKYYAANIKFYAELSGNLTYAECGMDGCSGDINYLLFGVPHHVMG